MAHSHGKTSEEKLELGPGANKLFVVSLVVGLIGLAVAFGTSMMTDLGVRRFYFAYLIAFAFFMSFPVGGLFFVLLQYCVRAGWSVNIRRVPEAFARTFPLFLVLAIPLLFSIVKYDGALYRWAQPVEAAHGGSAHGGAGHGGESHGSASNAAAGDGSKALAAGTHSAGGNRSVHPTGELTSPGAPAVGWAPYLHDSFKTPLYALPRSGDPNAYQFGDPLPITADGRPLPIDTYLVAPKKDHPLLLGKWGVIARIFGFLAIFSLIAYWYSSKSRKQDTTGDVGITDTLSVRAAPMLVIFGVGVTSLASDLLMSLDPAWYSTMYGPYYFAGSAISVMAGTIIVLKILQFCGYLKGSVNNDHFHDLSKFQFAFTFFWGYLAFSQFMLLWYASLPETAYWLARRGASTAETHLETFGGFTVVSLALLFGKLLIPFAGLLSRHVKRNPFGQLFWAVWILCFHALDIYWLVMPELTGRVMVGIPEFAALVGVGGLFVGFVAKNLASAKLRPVKDPRAPESLAFQQMF